MTSSTRRVLAHRAQLLGLCHLAGEAGEASCGCHGRNATGARGWAGQRPPPIWAPQPPVSTQCPPAAFLPQENILAESSAMLPDTRQRLEEAFRELRGLVVRGALLLLLLP